MHVEVQSDERAWWKEVLVDCLMLSPLSEGRVQIVPTVRGLNDALVPTKLDSPKSISSSPSSRIGAAALFSASPPEGADFKTELHQLRSQVFISNEELRRVQTQLEEAHHELTESRLKSRSLDREQSASKRSDQAVLEAKLENASAELER